MKSWKTTLVGIALVLSACGLFYLGKNIEGGVVLTIGIGFLSAKDSDVTGGTTQQ